jgi:hypothetical protein
MLSDLDRAWYLEEAARLSDPAYLADLRAAEASVPVLRLDPDLAVRRLPASTLARLQAARNVGRYVSVVQSMINAELGAAHGDDGTAR